MTGRMIKWHKLVDGDPVATGRYIIAHRGCSLQVNYYIGKGWDKDVSAFTHWAKEPRAPDDGTPQLFTREGREMRQNNDEYRAWGTLNITLDKRDSSG